MIEVRNLSKRFGPMQAVDELNFSVSRGEILGFLGPNGAGKTTTMRILTGFFPPTSGSAFIAGHDVVEEPMAARKATGYLPENVPLYVDMRVSEYLTFVGGIKGLDRVRTQNEVNRVMEATGITQRAGQLIKQLSKGYRQRVGLAQALIGDPPVLILDEPTIGLDPRQIVEIRSLVKSFAGEKTVILSSHILPEVAATCQRVVIINHGRVVAQGAPDILTSQMSTGFKLMVRGPQSAISDRLAQIPGITQVITGVKPDLEGSVVFTIQTESVKPSIRAEAAKAIVESGWELLEMSPVAATLEEVFVRLITTEQGMSEEEAA